MKGIVIGLVLTSLHLWVRPWPEPQNVFLISLLCFTPTFWGVGKVANAYSPGYIRSRWQKAQAYPYIGFVMVTALMWLFAFPWFALAIPLTLFKVFDVNGPVAQLWATFTVLPAVAYGGPWVSLLPSLWVNRRWRDEHKKGELDLFEEALLLWGRVIDFRQLAYLLGIVGSAIVITVDALPEAEQINLPVLLEVSVQALVLFLAVDQYLNTFRRGWLVRWDEARRDKIAKLARDAAHAPGR